MAKKNEEAQSEATPAEAGGENPAPTVEEEGFGVEESQGTEEVISETVEANAEESTEVPGPGQFAEEAPRNELGQPVPEVQEPQDPPVVNTEE